MREMREESKDIGIQEPLINKDLLSTEVDDIKEVSFGYANDT